MRNDDVITVQLQRLTAGMDAIGEDVRAWRPVPAIGPQQITVIGAAPDGGEYVTVTYPVGSDTVLSVQPGGEIETRIQGSRGPYETGLLVGDRIVYAPTGAGGPVFIFPFASAIPNA